MNNEKNALTFDLKNRGDKKNIIAIVAALIAAVTLTAGFCNSAGITLFPYAVIIASAICALFCALPKKLTNIAGTVLLLMLSAAVVITYNDLAEGLAAFANSIFTASESRQAYLYTKFEITAAADRLPYCTALAVSVILSAVTLLLTYCAAKNYFIAPLAVMAIAAGYEIYFGIAPNAVLNIAVFATLMLSAVTTSKRVNFKAAAAVILAATICLASLGTYAALPKQYRDGIPAIHAFSEKVRDEFTEGMQQYDEQPEEQKENENEQEETENGKGGTKKRASNPVRVNYTVLNFVLVLSVLLLIIAYLLTLLIKNTKKRRLMNSRDAKTAIISSFEYGFRYITSSKIKPTNAIPSEYITEIKSVYGAGCADAYAESVEIYQEALYSTHSMTVEHADKMRNNYKIISAAVMKNSSVSDKIRIKLKKML